MGAETERVTCHELPLGRRAVNHDRRPVADLREALDEIWKPRWTCHSGYR